MTVDTNASGRFVIAEGKLGQSRSISSHQGKSAFFTEVVKIGRYDLIYRVGAGGMATVFVARLSGLAGFERLVAVKVIHQHLADSRKFVQMFLDEARMAASIHHPNVVETYEVGREDGLFFIVGEFVPGQDLNGILRRAEEREKYLSQGMVAKIASQICFGLHAAHETRDKDGNPLNLIHRDVSPNNILISYDGFVKLIDFGVAWASNKMAQTESGALKGKIGYISPEQITGQTIDRRSDVFSVGVLAYTMATLTHPFPGNSDAERLNKIITGDMLPPSEMVPDINPEFERIILRAMANSPADRYRTAAEMGKELESFAESTGEAIKTESLAELMQEIFSDERAIHEGRISAYRAAIENDSANMDEFSDDDLFLSGTETYTEGSRSTYRHRTWSSRTHRRTRLVLISGVGGLVVAMALLLFFVFFRSGRSSGNGIDGHATAGQKQPLDNSNPSSSPKSAGGDNTATKSGSASKSAAPGLPLSVIDGQADASPSATDEDTSSPSKADPDDKTEVESTPSKRKRGKNKKTESDLLTSPYS